MKLTQILCKQHLERMARWHWFLRGKKLIARTKAEERARERGIEVKDAVETFIKPKREKLEIDQKLILWRQLPKDETHPEYKEELCYIFGDDNVLLEGVGQAQVLTNSVLATEHLPKSLEKLEESIQVPESIHNRLQKSIELSCIYDSEQKKLPKRKDPARPAFVFPRDYGITDVRKNQLLGLHLLSLCDESNTGNLSTVENAQLSLPIKAHGKLLQFDLTAEVLLTAQRPLTPPTAGSEESLPDIYPIHCTVSLQHHHFYNLTDLYPVTPSAMWKHAHTAFLHCNKTQVANIYETEVTADQSAGRLLVKAFCIAACEARALQQGQVKEPVTVQAVQTDGQNFQFGVFRLNSLDLTGTKHNVFWLSPSMALYDTCAYVNGVPTLTGYNPAVIQRLMAFVSNR